MSDTSSTDIERESGVPIEYSLFSQMKTMGSFHSAASERPSWKPPMLTAPSPKKQSVTRPSSRYLLAKATPAASGMCPPTMP